MVPKEQGNYFHNTCQRMAMLAKTVANIYSNLDEIIDEEMSI